MAKYQIIVQVDDEMARAMLVRGRGKKARIRWHGVTKDSRPEALARFLAENVKGVNLQRVKLLLMVSDRRIISGRVDQSAAPHRREVAELLRSSAMDQGMFATDESLAIGYTVTEEDNHWRAAFIACPENVFTEFVSELRQVGIGSIRVIPTENVFAQGLAASNEVVGIVDNRGSSAHFVLARNGQTIAVRKILIPGMGGDDGIGGNEAFLMLGGDLARTVEYFSDQGLPSPRRIILTSRSIEAETAEILAEMAGVPVESCELPMGNWLADDEPEVGATWRAHAFAVACLDAKRTPYLLQWSLPRVAHSGRRSILPISGIAAAAAGVCLVIFAERPERMERIRALEGEARKIEELESALRSERVRRAVPSIVVSRSNILKSKEDWVSISRVCAILGNEHPKGMGLVRIQLNGARFTLQGLIDDESGVSAMGLFGDLDGRIRAIPGVVRGTGKIDPYEPKYGGLPFEYQFDLEAGS